MNELYVTTYGVDETAKGPKTLEKLVDKMDLDDISTKLNTTIAQISNSIEKIDSDLAAYKLDEIELKFEITASGEISLIGSVGTECTGGITLKFKRG